MADVFTTVREELAIREAVGVIEMSPLAKYDIMGLDAERYVNYLFPKMPRRSKLVKLIGRLGVVMMVKSSAMVQNIHPSKALKFFKR